MKLKFIAGLLVAGASLFTACQPSLTPVQTGNLVASSFVVIPTEGGTATLDIKYAGEWTLDAKHLETIDKVQTEVEDYDWLTISEKSGNGPKTITFTATKGSSERNALLTLVCDDLKQMISVKQLGTVTEATCKDVIDGADGAIFRVSGVVTSIVNTEYGNWYLKDDTGEVYVYGTLDKNGAAKNFLSLNIEVGDQLTVEGPKTTYGTTIELVDVTVIEHTKAILKLVSPASYDIPVDGKEIEVNLVNKGQGIEFSIPEDATSWINLVSSSKKDVLADAFDPNSAVVAIDNTFKLSVAPIEDGERSAEITFKTTVKTGVDKTTGEPKHSVYTATIKVTQVAVTTATAAEISEAADDKKFRVTGLVSPIANTTYGNYDIIDHTGKIYVYGTLDAEGNTKNFLSLGIKEGDIVTVSGPKTTFKETAQLKNVTVEKHLPVTEVTVSDFLSKEAKSDVYYRLKGVVSNYKDGDLYGNFDIADETGSVYVYGLLKGWGGAKKLFPELNVKNGDTITIVGVRSEHSGKAQVGSAFFVSKAE